MSENQEKTKPFYYTGDIPDAKDIPEFWAIIQSPHLSNCINYLIINEIRRYPIEQLTDVGCRSQLCKLKAWQELLDLPKALLNKDEKELESNEDIPD